MRRMLAAAIIAGVTLVLPFSVSANADENQPGDDGGVVVRVEESTPPVEPSSEPSDFHIDISEESDDPIIQRDKSNDVGDQLKNMTMDEEQINRGMADSQWLADIIYYSIGILVGAMVLLVFLTNALGLFYVAVPIGFIRTILSGGQYGTATGMQNSGGMGGFGGMGGGFGGMGGGFGGMGGRGGMGNQSSGQNSRLKSFRMIPAAAIQAVEMAEGGTRGGGAMQSPGMNSPFGGGQQDGGSAAPVRPIPYYFRAQAVDMVILGIAVVVLVLSNILFAAGIDVGNAIRSGISFLLSKLI